MQEQHDLPDDLLLRPAGDDPCRPFDADAGHLLQARRLLLDEVEHRLAEAPHQPFGVDRADAADHSGTEIPLDALQRRRRAGLEEGRAELLAMGAVVHPDAVQPEPRSSWSNTRLSRVPFVRPRSAGLPRRVSAADA